MSNYEAAIDGMVQVTVLEALAEPTLAIGPCRSNQSTPSAGDADDQ